MKKEIKEYDKLSYKEFIKLIDNIFKEKYLPEVHDMSFGELFVEIYNGWKKIYKEKNISTLLYNKYVNTYYWKSIRRNIISKYNNTCAECNSNIKLCVHHISYKNIGNETYEDLVVLCSECHLRKHRESKAPKIVDILTFFKRPLKKTSYYIKFFNCDLFNITSIKNLNETLSENYVSIDNMIKNHLDFLLFYDKIPYKPFFQEK